MTYVWASVLLIANLLAWSSTLFTLPGNWLVLAFAAIYRLALPSDTHPQLSWSVIGLALVLALLGEVWEFMSGAAGAAKVGGSRRGALLAIIGSLVGSFLGAMLGLVIPVPVVPSMIGAVVGGALGAFVGAYYGERNRNHQERVAIGKGAFWGRLFGTAGKLAFGALMVILISVDSFADF